MWLGANIVHHLVLNGMKISFDHKCLICVIWFVSNVGTQCIEPFFFLCRSVESCEYPFNEYHSIYLNFSFRWIKFYSSLYSLPLSLILSRTLTRPRFVHILPLISIRQFHNFSRQLKWHWPKTFFFKFSFRCDRSSEIIFPSWLSLALN